jgi:CHAT domain-containing protein
MIFRRLILSLAACAAFASAASAAAVPDQFPLGESASSGAVCQALRNDNDPASNARGAEAWEVRCRGWEGALGRLYLYDYRGEAQIGPAGMWGRALASRAACGAAVAAPVKGLERIRRAPCKAFAGKVPYVAYSGVGRAGRTVAAEGFVQISDVLETGLRVVSGAAPPPKAIQAQAAASTAGVQAVGLAEAAATASSAPENLRERGFIRNTAWRFTDAETDFRALALDASVPASLRAEAFLNWALNTSNLGQFARADTLFAQAGKLADTSELRGLAFSYQALHLRNQRRFREAIDAAKKAQDLLSSLSPEAASGGPVIETAPDGALVIGPQLAAALKPAGGFSTTGVDAATRIQLRITQTELVQASCYQALGQPDQARAQLELARQILAQPRLARVETFLRAQVNADLAREYEAQSRGAEARQLLAQSLDDLRKQQPGSPVEAYMTMELARAEAISGANEQALIDFRAAIDLFRETRGSLSASADSISTYLELLMQRVRDDPSHAQTYAASYLVALESVASQGTADTVARLTARLNEKDTAAAGLIRALEDTRRQVRAKESEIALAESQGAYPAARKVSDQAELKAIANEADQLEQRVAAADPRYGQLVSSDVSLEDLQHVLKPGELYVKLSLLGVGGYGLAVTHDTVKPYRIALTQAQGAAAVAALRRPFETQSYLPAFDVAGAYSLYKTMFGPIGDEVMSARRMIYEPDNAMLSLPIAALVTDQASVDLVARRRQAIRAAKGGVLSYDGVAWLGRKAETSLVVSVAAFVQARQAPVSPAPRPLIGFGDSVQASASDPRAFSAVTNFAGVGDADVDLCRSTRDALLTLKPLNEATRELESVSGAMGGASTLVTGAAFSDTAIQQRTDLDQYRVLYFATHGLLPQPGGCLPEPALLTSLGDGDSDGLLDMTKIIGLKLDADLVVLSACDTGGGALGGGADTTGLGSTGEALGGLTRAFIYAGARSLIVSHWKIDSAATVRLMTAMFQSRQDSQSGSLQAAELKLMDSPDQYSHPYYWAAFAVVGDGARSMPR